MQYIPCQRIYERPSFLRQRRKQHGKILPRSHVTSGYAGLRLPRSQRRGLTGLKGRAQNLLKENADLVVGLGVCIGEKDRGIKKRPLPERPRLYFQLTVAPYFVSSSILSHRYLIAHNRALLSDIIIIASLNSLARISIAAIGMPYCRMRGSVLLGALFRTVFARGIFLRLIDSDCETEMATAHSHQKIPS